MENTKKLVKIILRVNTEGFSTKEIEVSFEKTKKNFVVKREFDGEIITRHWPIEDLGVIKFSHYDQNEVEIHTFCYPENVETMKTTLMAKMQDCVDNILRQAQKMSQIFVQVRNKV